MYFLDKISQQLKKCFSCNFTVTKSNKSLFFFDCPLWILNKNSWEPINKKTVA